MIWNRRRSHRLVVLVLVLVLTVAVLPFLASTTRADEGASAPAEGPLVKMLRGGKVAEERQGTVIGMIGKRGGGADLDFLLERALDPKGFAPANRLKALEALAEAAQTRGVRPSGDLGRLAPLIEGKADADVPTRLAAVRLAGLWKAEALGPALRAVAAAAGTSDPVRAGALDALAAVGGAPGRASIEALAEPGKPLAVRARAVAALARLDLDAAATRAARVLRDADKEASADDLAPLLAAFLNHRGGADALAAAIGEDQTPADAARLALRTMYALGHGDAGLVAALSKAAKLDAEVKPLDAKAMETVLADVASKGDPARGEAVFRRADLNCSQCHALSGAGGGVGPDLSALGASAPVDYIVNSIMLPDQAIKEEFHTLIVLTTDGQVYQGIVADRDEARVVLKEAAGTLRTVPASEIEESKEGGSLMPKGLVNFMTRAEFVDLVRFLSELGKPGPYAIRATPTIQRWRTLKPVPEALAKSVPDADAFRSRVVNADPARWLPAYARTGGDLPIADLASEADAVLYLRGDVEVSRAGAVVVTLNATAGVTAWVDDQPAPAFEGSKFAVELSEGRHALTFRVDLAARRAAPLRVEVLKPAGSTADYVVVGGR